MSERKATVLLEVKVGEAKKTTEFEINHAERILRMPKNGGWQLPEGSPYQLDKKNGFIRRENKRATKKSNEETDNK